MRMPRGWRTRIAVLAAVLVAWSLTAAGCNTIKGMGEDIESLGRGVQETSEKAAGY